MGDEEWTVITSDGGVRKRVTLAGVAGAPVAAKGQELSVHYTGMLASTPESPFDDSRSRGAPFKFVLGSGDVIRGWDLAFATMQVGERAVIECTAPYGYGDEGHPPRIPPDAALVFDVELLGCEEKKKELYQMSTEEKIEAATRAKAEGVSLFGEAEWDAASAAFGEAARLCDLAGFARNKTEEIPEALRAIYASSQLNAAQCALKLKDWPAAAAAATRFLKFDGTRNAKALFRRGVARSHMGLIEEARADLLTAAKLEPKNKAVRAEYDRVKALSLEQAKVQKGLYSAAFDKVDLFPDKPRNVGEPSTTDNPYVFFDFAAVPRKRRRDDDEEEEENCADDVGGSVVVRVFADACPKTARNFIALCTGERGVSKVSGKPLHYKNCKVHRVVDDFCIQTGDVVCGDGTSGESIYGLKFKDEHFKIKHDKPGVVSMANRGPDTNNSQFFITTADEAFHCDGKFVAFAQVVAGLDVVLRISKLKTPEGDDEAPLDYDVVIRNCGALAREEAEQRIQAEQLQRQQKPEGDEDIPMPAQDDVLQPPPPAAEGAAVPPPPPPAAEGATSSSPAASTCC
ncbi:hypothetical protein CTAYLR_001284 [Chrysophaeum taylorii]|uniref:peptidylprolyl isomerase n=1 Tax=Chrysophaeum taylorii TaxID=2483200 RepID=A0AAD7UCI6_9STRA|nr:hypothetical protein CTAYLR_001284 [Chrysophaeum taylorii]